MSRFMSQSTAALSPYVPGEQPKDAVYIKLNTNECPYPPAPGVADALIEAGKTAALYPDPEANKLRLAIAKQYSLHKNSVFAANGSDEVLAFAYMAFFDRGDKVYFPKPSYGFYPVYADLFKLSAHPIALADDFTLRVKDYLGLDGNIIIANPNTPTGIALPRRGIEQILAGNPDRLIIVDEAYVDFADDISALPLLEHYDNLLIVKTFSKSRSMAGLRLGYSFSRPEHIDALERIKFSFHPYNINKATQLAGIAAVQDSGYLRHVLGKIKATRTWVTERLREIGFIVLDSSANFIFVSLPGTRGDKLAALLRDKGVLVRFFDTLQTADFIRVSIGTDEDMDAFVRAMEEIVCKRMI